MIYKNLNPEKALIWRIVHRDNLSWILDNGLHCANSTVQSPNYINIGNSDLIDKRRHRRVPIPPGGTLSDYVPFYFTPFSVMMKNIQRLKIGFTFWDKLIRRGYYFWSSRFVMIK